MPFIYAMSDIHGYFEPLEENLRLIDLSNTNNKLIFCGDYIDYGKDSCKVLCKIKELTEKYPKQVVALMGNHEYMFLEFLSLKDEDIQTIEWLRTDKEFSTVNSFITSDTRKEINALMNQYSSHNYFSVFEKCVPIIKKDIVNNYRELIKWLKCLPFYYETNTQIFVHAGIEEDTKEYWKHGTSDEYFVSKYPATFGEFYKDIVAGHISTSSLTNDRGFHDVFWDKKSHYFIDGETNISGIVPLLKYDIVTQKYSNFKKQLNINGEYEFIEMRNLIKD